MSTIRELKLLLDQHNLDPRGAAQPSRTGCGTDLREMWSDGLATLALVTLASTVVFEALRLLLQ